MEYVGKMETIECTDCGTTLRTGDRYELKGEPDQVVCVQCCYYGGMSISDPDEACPNCGEIDWGDCYEKEFGLAMCGCQECGYELDLNDPAETGLPNREFKRQHDEDDGECPLCGGVHGPEGGVCVDEDASEVNDDFPLSLEYPDEDL